MAGNAEGVRVAVDGPIASIRLWRPDARNALSPDLIDSLAGAVAEVAASKDARACILSGEGRSFCAGLDLRTVGGDPAKAGDMLRGLARVMIAIRRLTIPTIAQAHGAAIGGGCGLMVVCDFAVTHPEAKIGYPEVDLGICPAVVAPWLVKKIGAGAARAILLKGGTMSGTEAHAAGMATHLVCAEAVEGKASELAQGLARGGPHAIALTKSWLSRIDGSDDEALLMEGAEISARALAGEEAQERLRARAGGKP